MELWVRIKNIVIFLLSGFFLVFGVLLLKDSFQLANPLEFVMTLFAASFIILFCIAGLLYAFFRFFPGNPAPKENHADDE